MGDTLAPAPVVLPPKKKHLWGIRWTRVIGITWAVATVIIVCGRMMA